MTQSQNTAILCDIIEKFVIFCHDILKILIVNTMVLNFVCMSETRSHVTMKFTT